MRGVVRLAVVTALVVFPTCALLAGAIVSLESPAAYDLQRVGFELKQQVEVDIEAVGIGEADARGQRRWSWLARTDDDPFLVYAWLLDSETREPVWQMDYHAADSEEDGLRRVQDSLTLEPGRYELYLFARLGWLADVKEQERSDSWWDRVFQGRRMSGRELEQALDSCLVQVSASGLGARDVRRFEIDGGFPEALMRFNRVGDSQFAVGGFELDRESELRLYSLIEKSERRGLAADYGWIVNQATRELVWSAADARFEPAGGGEKNRRIDQQITLEAGRYLVHYGTDDSHSFEEFNSAPPLDPLNWGLTLLPGEGFDPAGFRTFEPRTAEPLLELARAGNDEMFEQAFRLERAGSLHVQALGEAGDDDVFYDRGWIVEAATGDIVWEMTERNTVGAGGAEKNRVFDGLVELSAGEYVLYYVSDSSHSYEDWNAAMPFEPERWGVTLRPAAGIDSADFRKIDSRELSEVRGTLARIVRVGAGERRRESFQIDTQMRVRVYGLGEGGRGGMADYGYIQDASGKRIWEMSWDNARHAGGAEKNLVVDDVLTLDPGEYVVVYKTDGSHSFGDWNAAPPNDPLHWGMTVSAVSR